MKNQKSKLVIFVAALIIGIAAFIFLWQSRPLPTEIHAQTNAPNIETNELKSPQQITENSVNASSNSAIGKIDFGNFSYPKLWKELEKPAKLKNGELVFEGEYRCTTTISLDEVKYLDLTDDGEDDALVILNDQVACGSSWRATSFLVFTMKNEKPQLIWRFTTGSEAHGGLRNFRLDGKELAVELYGRCKIVGFEPKVDYSEIKFNAGSDRALESTTRFRFGWNGRKFGQNSLEVLPYPYNGTLR
jgi:hypothetical protein